jgi:hypothetical protein
MKELDSSGDIVGLNKRIEELQKKYPLDPDKPYTDEQLKAMGFNVRDVTDDHNGLCIIFGIGS